VLSKIVEMGQRADLTALPIRRGRLLRTAAWTASAGEAIEGVWSTAKTRRRSLPSIRDDQA